MCKTSAVYLNCCFVFVVNTKKMKISKNIKRASSNCNIQSKIKYNQKFCEKWLNLFKPWLMRCTNDPNKPFCKACQTRLDCNRCHLQRHERTTKHQRNVEILISKGEVAARQNLSIRQERSKYYLQRKKTILSRASEDAYEDAQVTDAEVDNDVCSSPPKEVPLNQITKTEIATPPPTHIKHDIVSDEPDSQLNIKSAPSTKGFAKQTSSSQKNASIKKEGIKLLMQIHKDKNDLMDSFKELMSASGPFTHSHAPREKNHVDLFFESVSSSVKAFSPKLIAEAKMRVSQLICELELRGLNTLDTTNANIPGNNNYPSPSTAMIVQPTAGHSFIVNQTQSGGEIHEQHYEPLS